MGKSKKKHDRPRVLVMGGGLSDLLARAGGESVYMGSSDSRAAEAASHDNIHALVLTGGSDVDPSLYGAQRHKMTQSPYHSRDEAEIRALHAAFKRGIPILGICRGSQMINVAFGGTLHQHIPDVGAHRWHLGHDHRVNLKKGSRIAKAMGALQPWVVSIHHQAVDRPARGFRVSAKSMDGLAEAVESLPNSGLPWIIGTQFHPEISTNAHEQRLFGTLVREAARVAGLPTPRPFTLPRPKPAPYKAPEPKRWTSSTPTILGADGMSSSVGATIATQSQYGKMNWFCFRCGLEFDFRADHVDHMYALHEVDLVPFMTAGVLDDYIDEVAKTTAEMLAIEERWLSGNVNA
jgi:putative glutamine amidotransferase